MIEACTFAEAMACPSSDGSRISSSITPSACDQKPEEDKWPIRTTSLAQKARNVMDGGIPGQPTDTHGLQPQTRDTQQLQQDSKWKGQGSVTINKGLEAIASSLSLLSDTIGTAIEEGMNLVETRRTNLLYMEPQKKCLQENLVPSLKEYLPNTGNHQANLEKTGPTKDTQLKASRDVAMAMATKAKLLLRELKNVKADLAFTKSRCLQVEEENKRLRESIEKGAQHDEDDLVRLQLEALLSEKARLAQENAAYARENQFLHEMVQYHQLTSRSMGIPDDSLMNEMALLDMDAAVDMDLKDIVALEESVKTVTSSI